MNERDLHKADFCPKRQRLKVNQFSRVRKQPLVIYPPSNQSFVESSCRFLGLCHPQHLNTTAASQTRGVRFSSVCDVDSLVQLLVIKSLFPTNKTALLNHFSEDNSFALSSRGSPASKALRQKGIYSSTLTVSNCDLLQSNCGSVHCLKCKFKAAHAAAPCEKNNSQTLLKTSVPLTKKLSEWKFFKTLRHWLNESA